MNGLDEYTDYVYRVDVTDGNNNTIGTKAVVKTYCSGKGLECDGTHPCMASTNILATSNEAATILRNWLEEGVLVKGSTYLGQRRVYVG